MADLKWFDANAVPPAEEYRVVPSGEYTAAIESSEMKDTKSGDGKYLALCVQILEGQYKGRKLWENLNIVNKSQKAQEIARGTLSAICRAVGVMTPRDSADLHYKPLRIKVGVDVDKATGEARNKVRGWMPLDGKPASPAAVGLRAVPEVKPAAGGEDIPF